MVVGYSILNSSFTLDNGSEISFSLADKVECLIDTPLKNWVMTKIKAEYQLKTAEVWCPQWAYASKLLKSILMNLHVKQSTSSSNFGVATRETKSGGQLRWLVNE